MKTLKMFSIVRTKSGKLGQITAIMYASESYIVRLTNGAELVYRWDRVTQVK